MNNNKSTVIIVSLFAIIVLLLGYFLSKNSPQGQGSQASASTPSDLAGKPMPEIKLLDKNGRVYTLADFKGKTVVLFFNEGLMCYPACWNQIAAFGGDPRFNNDEIQAISVVADSVGDWQRAIMQMPQLAKSTTLFDVNTYASRQLGMLTTASSMHKGILPGHTYVLIDKNGIVRYVLDDPNMAIANDILFTKIGELK